MPTLDNIIVLGRKPNIVQRLKRGLGQLFNQQYVLDTERGRYLNLNNKKKSDRVLRYYTTDYSPLSATDVVNALDSNEITSAVSKDLEIVPGIGDIISSIREGAIRDKQRYNNYVISQKQQELQDNLSTAEAISGTIGLTERISRNTRNKKANASNYFTGNLQEWQQIENNKRKYKRANRYLDIVQGINSVANSGIDVAQSVNGDNSTLNKVELGVDGASVIGALNLNNFIPSKYKKLKVAADVLDKVADNGSTITSVIDTGKYMIDSEVMKLLYRKARNAYYNYINKTNKQ